MALAVYQKDFPPKLISGPKSVMILPVIRMLQTTPSPTTHSMWGMHHVLVTVEKTLLFSVRLVSLGSLHALTLLLGLQLALVKVALVKKALFPPLHTLTPLSPSPPPINVLVQENPLTFLECSEPH